jgi:hypothetical protein
MNARKLFVVTNVAVLLALLISRVQTAAVKIAICIALVALLLCQDMTPHGALILDTVKVMSC